MPKKRKVMSARDRQAIADFITSNGEEQPFSNTQYKLYMKSIKEDQRRMKLFEDSNFKKLIPGED